MGNSRDESTQGDFPDIEPQSNISEQFINFKSVDDTVGRDEGESDLRIGRYRLIRPIGEGGMGVVWRAVQEHPVKRDVALKLVRKDVGKDALGRFEAERQAIAMMDHPNIAKILDADTTESGAPYFVMELVKGIPLDQYCNNRKLSIEERLRLMLPVCRAVQHAHQKAIIHRDLKHSNILVAENDDEAIPKVIDFGLAKALGSQKSLTDKTVYTEFGKVVGTIYYMSPEQADSDGGMDIDTRSDIFSLGVVLYKLLTGRTPIQVEGDGHSVIGAIKIIREKDPVAPSIAVRDNEDCIEWVNDSTPSKPDRHAEQLKGDLDSIVLKALEKDRRSRYETANGLALDIERYLNKEPVLAQPRTTMYAVRKFVQRNKGLVASVVTIIGLLIAGIVGTSLSLNMALSETARANENAELAKNETGRANNEKNRAKAAEARAKEQEKLKSIQLRAQLNKSAWSDLQGNNIETAWDSLRRIDSATRGWTSRYIANEMFTCKPGDSLHGHAHYVLSLDTSSKGDFIVSGGADDTVYLWDARNHEQVYRRLFDDIVKCVRFSDDQKYFAVADGANVVTVFETLTGNLVRRMGPYHQDVSSLSFHPREPIIAIGFLGIDKERLGTSRIPVSSPEEPNDGQSNPVADLYIANLDSGKVLQKIKAHGGEITSLAFDATGDRLVSGCIDGILRIWKPSKSEGQESASSFELERKIIAHPGGILKVDVSRDSKRIASCGEDQVASIWDTETGSLIQNLSGHTAAVNGVSFSPSAELVATCSNDQKTIVWNLDGEPVAIWRGHTGAINEVCFGADGKHIITASDDQTLQRWDASPAGTSVSHDFKDTFEVWQADFSPDKSMVATASENGVVSVIDTATGKMKKKLLHDNAVLALCWLKDERLLTVGYNNGLQIWDRLDRPGPIAKPLKTIDIVGGLTWDISASPDENQIAIACGEDWTARILDATTFKEVGVLKGHTEGLASVRFSPDGKLLVTASDDGTIKVWSAETFEELKTLEGHNHPVWRAMFSPSDPNLIASSAADGTIILWDLESGSATDVQFEGHKSAIAGLTFADNGRSLVSASDDQTVRVWDVETGVELFVFQQQPVRPMIHASFSRDGQSLVTTGVGLVTIQHATPQFASPYLKRDAEEERISAETRIVKESVTKAEVEEISKTAEKISDLFPTWESWQTLGIAQSKLGRHIEAVESLNEAARLKQILYGGDDIRPWIEGYQAISYFQIGEKSKALEAQERLEEIAEGWGEDAETQMLREKVRSAIGN